LQPASSGIVAGTRVEESSEAHGFLRLIAGLPYCTHRPERTARARSREAAKRLWARVAFAIGELYQSACLLLAREFVPLGDVLKSRKFPVLATISPGRAKQGIAVGKAVAPAILARRSGR